MTIFDPEENTAICMYGPPEYFTDPSEINSDVTPIDAEDETFFGKLIAALKKLFDFIKGLFKMD